MTDTPDGGGQEAERTSTFEEALAELDAVVSRLETGAVGLEEAVALFERGRVHLAVCRERLAASEARIRELTAEDDPAPGAAPEGPL
ncbi:MAG: exodeoxyribonuclease VII small subunit [Miltoncostaeaceae bacterium]